MGLRMKSSSKGERILTALVVPILFLVGCTTGGNESSAANAESQKAPASKEKEKQSLPKPEKLPVATTVSKSGGYRVVVNKVESDGRDTAVLYFTITNTTSSARQPKWALVESRIYTHPYKGPGPTGVTLVDPEAEKRYRPLVDKETYCYCSRAEWTIPAHQGLTLFAAYALPAEVDTVNVDIPGYGMAKNVPVERIE
jgi:hypothetical protein